MSTEITQTDIFILLYCIPNVFVCILPVMAVNYNLSKFITLVLVTPGGCVFIKKLVTKNTERTEYNNSN